MPKPAKKTIVEGRFFRWVIYPRNDTFYADGRSANPGANLKRYSLDSADLAEAMKNLKLLDAMKAVELGRADASILNQSQGSCLSLEEGTKKYLLHVGRAPVMGGAGKTTLKRYRAVFDKFTAFGRRNGVETWDAFGKRLLEAYGAWLDGEDYAYVTEYLELTTLKQAIRWMIGEKLIPATCAFTLELKKPGGTTTYCYTQTEVSAMIAHCTEQPEFTWLADVIVALAHTGLRIGELSGLRWSDLDDQFTRITLTDESRRASRQQRGQARTTKTHHNRTLPVHPRLREIFERMQQQRHRDGRVFHGPAGGLLKPDTLRMILKRDVLTPLSKRLPSRGAQGLIHGRLHSFRHFFCSTCANAGTPEQVLMDWLGHRDSRMVRRYFHLRPSESQRHMNKIDFAAATGATLAPAKSA